MAKPVDVTFFQQFANNELEEKEFIQKLQTVTTEFQKKNVPSVQQVELIAQNIASVSDKVYSENVELFLKFALHLSNRGIYRVFESYNSDFENINLASGNITHNIVALYVIKRVYHSENHKYILIFLNGVLREQRQIEKKFILLEIYTKILPQLEKREIYFRDILPLILIVMKEALDKYLRYRKDQIDGSLNLENDFVKSFLQNFQQWTVSFFKRIFGCLKNTPELKENAKQQAIRDLLTVDDLYDYDDIQDQVYKKAEKPALAVKHLVLMFLFDLLEGIIEVQESMTTSQIEPKIVQELHTLTMGMLNEVHSNKLELVQNYLQSVRFSIQRDQEITRKFHVYDLQMLYNPVGIAYLTQYILFQDHSDNRNVQAILSDQQKLKLALGVIYEQKYFSEAKCKTYHNLLGSVAKLLAQMKPSTHKINSLQYFLTPLNRIIVELLERAGSGLKQEEEQLYIQAWKNLSSWLTLEAYTSVIVEALHDSVNVPLLAHLINHYRSTVGLLLKDKTVGQDDIFKLVNKVHVAVKKKSEIGTIDSKIQIIDSLVLLAKVLFLHFPLKDNVTSQKYYKLWHTALHQYEKDVQKTLDYIHAKRQEKEAQQKEQKNTNPSDDAVYYQLLNQENVLQITYYNIQDVNSLQN